MFIVKRIGQSGSEELYQTPTIRYSPGHAARNTLDMIDEPATVWIRKADEPEFPLTGGTVFVMNEAGKTVARYNLTASEYRDPEQTSFAEFSREKDGGLAAEAVEKLRSTDKTPRELFNDGAAQRALDVAEIEKKFPRALHGRVAAG